MLDLTNLRECIEQERKAWDHVSLGVAVVKDGEVILSDGFGMADAETGRAADSRTLYQIGSCSKAFTAAAVAVLVEQGKVQWDDPVRKHLPWLRYKDPYVTETVTIRDMLCHRTGVPRYDAYWICNPCTRREMAENLRNMDAVCGFRAGWNYQNNCYTAIGLLVEEVSGLTWEAFVQKYLLDPIGMSKTTFYLDGAAADGNCALPYGRAPGEHRKGFRRIDWLRSPLEDMEKGIGAPWGPAGSIISCADDMAKWVLFHLNKGKVGDVQLISEQNMAQMHKVNMVMDEPLIAKFPEIDFPSYGLGWFIDCYRGRKMIQHGGNINGFSALTMLMPNENIGVFVITNMDGSLMTYSTMYDIADRLLGETAVESWHDRWRAQLDTVIEASESANKGTDRAEGTAPSHPLSGYAGTYRHPALGRVMFREAEGRLEIAYEIHDTFAAMEHWHYDTFKVADPDYMINGIKAIFLINEAGAIDRVEIPLGLDPRIPPAVFVRDTDKKE